MTLSYVGALASTHSSHARVTADMAVAMASGVDADMAMHNAAGDGLKQQATRNEGEVSPVQRSLLREQAGAERGYLLDDNRLNSTFLTARLEYILYYSTP